jgi:hypothetical protein
MENEEHFDKKAEPNNRFLEMAVTFFLAVVFCFLILKFIFF